ncbi:protein ADM2 [Echeneis naucrates]|uniref:protein ADM2 n=1 Tax=Echeneis naucrates TaxID=173247 RepID=UPI0011133E52|nr:protein ADM2-like [Echeneis naucrates]
MCVLLPAWLCLLLALEVQSRTVTLQSFSPRHRLSLSKGYQFPKPSHAAVSPTVSDVPVATDNHITMGDRNIIWMALQQNEPPPKLSELVLDQSNRMLERTSRGRRHANSGGGRGHSHLMRVGCVLGTCQVQNLSHRLYQLIGQSGREDSSPINPRSPHSYG